MIRTTILLFCLLVDRAWGMDSFPAANRMMALNLYHRDHVQGVSVLPREKLKKEDMEGVYADLDRDLSYEDKGKSFFRRNLCGIVKFLKDANPEFVGVCGQSTNLLILDAYTSLAVNQPVFSDVGPMQQEAVLYLTYDVWGRNFFHVAGDDGERFLADYSERDMTLGEALGEFMRRNGYKPETIQMTLHTEKALCAEHMLDHFVNADDHSGKAFCGYFVTSAFQNKTANKEIAKSIIDVLFGSKMTRMVISADKYESAAVVFHIKLGRDEVPGLGRVMAEAPVIAFSSSAKGDIFFPTDWVKAVILFKRSVSGVLKISLVSVYPDAIGLSGKEALDFQKK